jgi:predicted Zn-dependent peptidase
MGISLAANAGREQTALLADCPRASLEGAVELLCDAAVRPRFEQWRVDAEVTRLKAAWEALLQDPQSYTLEAASTAAFEGALSAPLVPSKRDLEYGAVAEEVQAWHEATFRAGSVVLAVSGAEVEEVAHVAGELLAELPEGEAPAPPSTYTGGYHSEAMGGDGLAHRCWPTSSRGAGGTSAARWPPQCCRC